MRAFVAVEVAEDIRRKVAELQETLGRTGAKVKWVAPEILHLTLKFLGEIDYREADALKLKLAGIAAAQPPFKLEFIGAGTFPPKGAPRVIWVGCREGAKQMTSMAEAMGQDRDYAPHLTIGRCKFPAKARPIRDEIPNFRETEFGVQEVTEFALIKSFLTPKGPIYTPIKMFALKK